MRKLFTLATAFVLASGMMAQQTFQFKGKVQNLKPNPIPTEKMLHSTQKSSPNVGGGVDQDLSTATVKKLLSLPNAYGYAAAPGQKQLTALPSQNAVAFVNRQDPAVYSLGGTSGSLRYAISTNQGDTWSDGVSVGGIINTEAVDSGPARYPNAILFQNGGTTAADLKIHVVSPTVDAATLSGWTYQSRVTVQNAAAAGAYTSQEDYRLYNTGIFEAQGAITERGHNSGEFWMLCTSSDTTVDAMYVFKGMYDPTPFGANSGQVNWTLMDTLTANWNFNASTTTPGLNYAVWSGGAISFSPDGSKGYVAAIGDIVGGRDSSYMPVFWDFNGTTFDNAYQVDINMPDLSAYVMQWKDSTGTSVSDGHITTGFDFDMIVDKAGDPHFFSVIGAATKYSISSNFGMRMMDIHKKGGVWYATEIAKQNAFREEIGTAFPVDIAPALARAVDGNNIFYTWTDTPYDSTAPSSSNSSPDMWGRMLDVNTGMMTHSVNWTLNDLDWHTKARVAKTSEYVFSNDRASACGKIFEVPTTIINYSNITDPAKGCQIYYFSDITYACDSAMVYPTSVTNLTLDLANFSVYPNPAKSILNVDLTLNKVDNIVISLININGQSVVNKVMNNATVVKESLNVANLASGMYFLQVTSSNGTQTKKVIIN